MIQTHLFIVGWAFSFTFSKYWKVLLCTTKYYSVLLCTTKYDSVLQSTMSDLVNFGRIWPSRSRPRSRPVPWNPRAVSIHSHVAQEEKTGLRVQCRIIWFNLSRIWNHYHDSRHSVPGVRNRHFTKVVVPDVGSPRNDPDPFIDA